MARNISQTMELVADEIGLRVDIPNLDVARNAFAAALASALDRQDVDQMSFAFQAVRQEWNSDYTERYITELRLFDVSAVTFPANTATIMALREQYMEQQETRRSGYSLNRARAEALRLLG